MLRDLSTLVGAVADDIRNANRTTAKIDLALARAKYSSRLEAVTPATAGVGQRMRLIRARHPLLEEDVVPLTAQIGPDWSALVITGPNTGGKTVAMKTVGLAALMHQSGLRIPADEGSALPVFDGVYADIGDQQSISESVSTFGSHIQNVVKILRHAGPQSLVLLDELGTSTDPEEGSALAKAVISHLANKGAATIVTTHHRTVAAFADASDDLMNASFQLDPDTLAPTYEMTIGAPGRSYAMAVAERLGLPDDILEDARSLIEPQHLLFEDWLTELQRERQQLQTSVEEAAKARAEVESLREELDKQVDFLVTHRDDLMEATRRSILQRFREISRRLDGAEASLSWGVPAVAGGSPPPTYDRVERIRRDLASVEVPETAPVQRLQPVSRPLEEGDTVFIRGMNLTGEIVGVNLQSDEAEVSIGRVRVNVDLHRLSRVDSEQGEETDAETPRVTTDVSPPMQSIELDLRGMRAADAQVNLDEFLDRAILDGASKLRVIHGRGTGVLRNVVRDHLRYHRSVSDFGPEPRERGGNGATWVQMS